MRGNSRRVFSPIMRDDGQRACSNRVKVTKSLPSLKPGTPCSFRSALCRHESANTDGDQPEGPNVNASSRQLFAAELTPTIRSADRKATYQP